MTFKNILVGGHDSQPLKGSKITIPRRSQSQKCQVSGGIIVFDVSFHSLKKLQTNPWKRVLWKWDNCFTHIEPRTFLTCWSSKCETLGGMSASNIRATNFTYFTRGELFATCFFQRRWRPNVIWRILPWRNTMGRWTKTKLSTRHSKSGTECSSDAQSQSLHRTERNQRMTGPFFKWWAVQEPWIFLAKMCRLFLRGSRYTGLHIHCPFRKLCPSRRDLRLVA